MRALFDAHLYLGYFFFFQAEDGIRDIGVTGVQTCALPISRPVLPCREDGKRMSRLMSEVTGSSVSPRRRLSSHFRISSGEIATRSSSGSCSIVTIILASASLFLSVRASILPSRTLSIPRIGRGLLTRTLKRLS